MPKINTNSKINYLQTPGRVIQHDIWMDQAVTQDSSPTFGNLFVVGDTQIDGNLYVYGNTSIFNTNITEFEDNILLINRKETGPGVTLGLAGFEVSRGTGQEGFRAVFRESDDTFRIGFVNSTQAVATREDTPLNRGVAVWDNTTNRFNSKSSIDISIDLKSTENSISSSTGSLRVAGGIGVIQDVFVGGKTNYNNAGDINWNTPLNELQINSNSRVSLRPGTDVYIPFNKSLTFGTSGNSIVSGSSDNLTINANGKISIPSDIPFVFSKTDNLKKIVGDSSGNLIISSGLDINLTPGRNISIPALTPIIFGSSSQRILGNNFGDVAISSNNNILLNPVGGLDVIIPQESGVKFGSLARIWSSPSNSLLMNASGIIVTSGTFRLENGTSLYIGQTEVRYSTSGSGVVQVLGTVEIPNMIITTVSTGNLGVTGDAYIKGNTVIDGNLNVNGTTTTINTDVQLIKDNLIVVNSAPGGLSDSGILMKRFGSNYAGLVYQESSNQFVLVYTSTDPGTAAVNFSSYAPLQSDRITINNTGDVVTSTFGSSLIVGGGAFVSKSLRIGNDIYLPDTGTIYLAGTSTGSLIRSTASGTDTLISGIHTYVSGTTNATINSTSASLIVSGGQHVSKNLVVDGTIFAVNTSTGHQLGNLIFNDANILSTNGTSINFPNGLLTKSLTIDNYILSQSSAGQLIINGSSVSGTSGIVISTDYLDILGQTTITDNLELFEGSMLLNSGSTVFSFTPTSSSLQLTTDSKNNSDLVIQDLNVNLESTNGNLTISNGIYTKFNDQIDLSGKLVFKLDNTSSSVDNWFRLSNLETFSSFTMMIDDSFLFRNETGSYLHSYIDSLVAIRVYQDQVTNAKSYYINVDANSLRVLSIFNKTGGVSKLAVTISSLPNIGVNLVYNTVDNQSNGDLFIGNIYSYGSDANFSDSKPIFGYRNADTTGSTNVGVAFERSKSLVVDSQSPIYILTLPSQSGVITNNQIKFGVTGPTDDLTGAILQTADSEIYRIKNYDPSIKVATIEGAFGVLPQLNDNVKIYDQAFIDFVYNQIDDVTELKYNPKVGSDPYSALKVGDLLVTRNGSINSMLSVNSTKSATGITSAACVVAGGVGIGNNLIVKNNIQVTGTNGSPSILTNSSLSSIELLEYNNTLSIINNGNTTGGLFFNSTGNIAIGTTNVSSTASLTFSSVGSIGIDNQNGSLNLLDRLKLYGNSVSKVEVSAGTLITNAGCQVSILNTTSSSSNTTGALVVGGGLTVSGSSNAISSSVGGSLTVAGGASVAKDLYIGGNLVINGSIELSGAVVTPSISIYNSALVNCNLATVVYTKLVKLSLSYTLQVCLEINPNAAYQNTEVQFTLPGRIDPFTKRTDTFTSCSGWSDDTAVNPLFNVISCGVPGTQRVLVKFQSVSTNTHYLQVMCMYNEF